jgi:hypothetical protein
VLGIVDVGAVRGMDVLDGEAMGGRRGFGGWGEGEGRRGVSVARELANWIVRTVKYVS